MTPPTVKHIGRPHGKRNLTAEEKAGMKAMASEGWGMGAIARRYGVSPIWAGRVVRSPL